MIDEKDLVWRFFAATSGPGGQNVNKVATAVELRWNVAASGYGEVIRQRIVGAAGRKYAASSGEIVIVAKGTRSQEANKAAALLRLKEIISKGTRPVVKRRPSKPTKGSKERRLEGKRVRSGIKAGRGKVVAAMLLMLAAAMPAWADGVVLLHGIARSAASLATLEHALQAAGYATLNVDYAARENDLDGIVAGIEPQVDTFAKAQAEVGGRVHFVTHSMGGLVARVYLRLHRPANLGRVVMLAPPNQGSEVADLLAANPLYKAYFGPAGQQLVTSQSTALRRDLGPVDYPLGVIAGDRSINLVSSWLVIPGADDGKVAVSRTAVPGMSDFAVLHVTHPLMMYDPAVVSQTLAFLRTGRFGH